MSLLSQSAFVKPVGRHRKLRGALAVAVGAALVFAGTACSAGQVSQTATQAPAINGANMDLGKLALRDVLIVYPDADDPAKVFAAGGPFQLAFVVANDDPVNASKLVSIKAPTGTVTLSGNTTVPAGLALRAGTPDGMTAAPGQELLQATFTNAGKTVAPGLAVPLVFTFSTQGKTETVTVETPVDAGATLERKDKVEDPGHGGGRH
ncbi:hypothetical protein GOARA_045_00570 [Gordonia araii NBRC 100433]|uniref:Lipoprotein LpqE n=1 Tax=Gordonia araii NBRC 100433 TaxID=1073574 RepID=G7H1H8_9ACTN|nr:hypothetical protein [Gordonia araii]GAB09703.1 hypothetical protein GOARA_045_00570 [Gordonia araii NBRC 100433]